MFSNILMTMTYAPDMIYNVSECANLLIKTSFNINKFKICDLLDELVSSWMTF